MNKLYLLFIFVIGIMNAQKLSSAEISLINQGDVNTALPVFQTVDLHQHAMQPRGSGGK